MRELEGQVRIPSGCAISAVISREGRRMTGAGIVESMKSMRERSNGLGGGFAGYGIYPTARCCPSHRPWRAWRRSKISSGS